MEALAQAITNWIIVLFTERWIELLVLAVLISVWRWMMAHKLRDRIKALEDRVQSPPSTPTTVTATSIFHFHGNIGTVNIGPDGMYHTPFDGSGEITSPGPIRTVPLEEGAEPIRLYASEQLGISESVEVKLIKGPNGR